MKDVVRHNNNISIRKGHLKKLVSTARRDNWDTIDIGEDVHIDIGCAKYILEYFNGLSDNDYITLIRRKTHEVDK